MSDAGDIDKQHSTTKKELVGLISQLSSQFAERRLTVRRIEGYLAISAEQSESKKSWALDGENYQVRITAWAKTKDAPVTEIRFYTNDINQLMLTDLEKLFGKSRVFVSSKTTWVSFEKLKTKNGQDMVIKAELFSPPSKEPSPVLMLMLRQD